MERAVLSVEQAALTVQRRAHSVQDFGIKGRVQTLSVRGRCEVLHRACEVLHGSEDSEPRGFRVLPPAGVILGVFRPEERFVLHALRREARKGRRDRAWSLQRQVRCPQRFQEESQRDVGSDLETAAYVPSGTSRGTRRLLNLALKRPGSTPTAFQASNGKAVGAPTFLWE